MFDGGVDMAYARAGSWETLYTVSVLLIIINATKIPFLKGFKSSIASRSTKHISCIWTATIYL